MDGRCRNFRLVSESAALDRANDVLALANEGYGHLDRSHKAHVSGDLDRYLLEAIDCAEALGRIRNTARRWADDVMGAPEISPDQLPLLLAA
jgi:hypothetical protein